MLFSLFKYRLKMLFSVLKGGGKPGRAVLFLIAFLVLALSLAAFSFGIYENIRANPGTGGQLLEQLISLMFHGIFALLCFTGLSLAVFTVFFGKDLELLLSLPIKPSAIFIYKITEALVLNVRFSFLFLIPLLAMLGIYYNSSIFYYIVAIVITVSLASIPGSLGIVLASFISRKTSKGRLKAVIGITGSLLGLGVWAGFHAITGLMPSQSSPRGIEFISNGGLISSPIFSYLPSGWASGAAMSAAAGSWIESLEFVLMLIACSAVLGYLAFKATARHYAGGIVGESAQPSTVAMVNMRIGQSPFIAHVKRDILLLLREPNVMMQSIVMLLFLLLFPFITSGDEWQDIVSISISPIGAIFAVFFGGQISSRLIPLERLGFWWNLVTPQGARLALLGKVLTGMIFTTVLVVLVGIVHLIAGRVIGVTYILFLIGFSWSGFAVGLPLGIHYANFKWDNPKRMLRTGGGFLYVLATIITGLVLYGIVVLAARFLPHMINPAFLALMISIGLLTVSVAATATKIANLEWMP
ncbi:MAG: putative ABC exporter domain-containing protein [candidate division Zixibacteria bacterium]